MHTAIKNIANGYGDLWGTPYDLWAEICEEVFQLEEGQRIFDPCPASQPLPQAYSYLGNGLEMNWFEHDLTFVNPPFSDIYPWAQMAARYSAEGTKTVMLVPVRTDQPWWDDFAPFASIIFIRGRVKYIDHRDGSVGKSPAFPSCLLVFDGQPKTNSFWWPKCHQLRKAKYAEKILKWQKEKHDRSHQ